MNNNHFTIITFYQFKVISNKDQFIYKLKDLCKFNKIRGTVIVADEGVNGTLAGLENSINKVIKIFKDNKFYDLNLKFSYYKYMPFQTLKIKNKKEIVTLRSKYSNPEKISGKRISAEKWNSLIKKEDTLLIDVRNDFEVKIGTFQTAINPNTKSFTDFKNFVDKNLSKSKNKKIAMFCTGGIRCEKASSYMIAKGFKNISQLDGGIINYLGKIPQSKSMWNGECFVFDNRVSLKNELKDGTYKLCHGCRSPISEKDLLSKFYNPGISCPKCFNKTSIEKKKNLAQRNKQILLSKKRGMYNRFLRLTVDEYK